MISLTLLEDSTGRDGEIARGTTGLKDQDIFVDWVWKKKKDNWLSNSFSPYQYLQLTFVLIRHLNSARNCSMCGHMALKMTNDNCALTEHLF